MGWTGRGCKNLHTRWCNCSKGAIQTKMKQHCLAFIFAHELDFVCRKISRLCWTTITRVMCRVLVKVLQAIKLSIKYRHQWHSVSLWELWCIFVFKYDLSPAFFNQLPYIHNLKIKLPNTFCLLPKEHRNLGQKVLQIMQQLICSTLDRFGRLTILIPKNSDLQGKKIKLKHEGL